MTTSAEVQKVSGETIARSLEDVCAKLNPSEGQVTLDVSDLRRIDPSGLRAFEDLAAAAADKAVTIVLQGVNVDVYKVLKLARLTARFSFVN
jgi:anti-anti-sigma regulatory factor